MAALHHVGARRHQIRQFTIIGGIPKVKRHDGILFIKQESPGNIVPADQADPLGEIGGNHGEGISFEQGWDARRRLAPVGQPVKPDARGIDIGQGDQPIERPLILTEDEREK